jgi:hypothetical protein
MKFIKLTAFAKCDDDGMVLVSYLSCTDPGLSLGAARKLKQDLSHPEPIFVNLLRSPGIDSQSGGPVRNPTCRTGPPGNIGHRIRFLGIDSCTVKKRIARFPSPAGMSLPNSPWAGIMTS